MNLAGCSTARARPRSTAAFRALRSLDVGLPRHGVRRNAAARSANATRCAPVPRAGRRQASESSRPRSSSAMVVGERRPVRCCGSYTSPRFMPKRSCCEPAAITFFRVPEDRARAGGRPSRARGERRLKRLFEVEPVETHHTDRPARPMRPTPWSSSPARSPRPRPPEARARAHAAGAMTRQPPAAARARRLKAASGFGARHGAPRSRCPTRRACSSRTRRAARAARGRRPRRHARQPLGAPACTSVRRRASRSARERGELVVDGAPPQRALPHDGRDAAVRARAFQPTSQPGDERSRPRGHRRSGEHAGGILAGARIRHPLRYLPAIIAGRSPAPHQWPGTPGPARPSCARARFRRSRAQERAERVIARRPTTRRARQPRLHDESPGVAVRGISPCSPPVRPLPHEFPPVVQQRFGGGAPSRGEDLLGTRASQRVLPAGSTRAGAAAPPTRPPAARGCRPRRAARAACPTHARRLPRRRRASRARARTAMRACAASTSALSRLRCGLASALAAAPAGPRRHAGLAPRRRGRRRRRVVVEVAVELRELVPPRRAERPERTPRRAAPRSSAAGRHRAEAPVEALELPERRRRRRAEALRPRSPCSSRGTRRPTGVGAGCGKTRRRMMTRPER